MDPEPIDLSAAEHWGSGECDLGFLKQVLGKDG
jgi:hypothetical protein